MRYRTIRKAETNPETTAGGNSIHGAAKPKQQVSIWPRLNRLKNRSTDAGEPEAHMTKQSIQRQNSLAIVAAALLWLGLEGAAEALGRFVSGLACHAAGAVPSLVLAFWQACRAQVSPQQLWDSVPRMLVWFWPHLLALAAAL
jgi:hypothetical protein